MELGLEGKAVLVTGAGRGIGRAIVLGFAKEDARAAINERKAPGERGAFAPGLPGGGIND